MPTPTNLEQYLEKLKGLPPFQKKLKDIPNEDYELDILIKYTMDDEAKLINVVRQ